MSRNKLSRTLAAVTVAVLLLPACGGDADVAGDPKTALSEAITALGDYAGYDLTVRLDAGDGARAALADDGFDEATVDTILASRLEVAATGLDTPDDAADDSFGLSLDLGDDEDVFELRGSPDDVYLRAAVSVLLDRFDPAGSVDPAALRAQAGMVGLGDAAAALIDGGWVHLAGLSQLAGAAGAGPTPDADQAEGVREQVTAALRSLVADVEVTHVGSEDAGEHVRIVATGAQVSTFVDSLASATVSLGGADGPTVDEALGGIPADARFPVDAWIAGGRLTQIGVDLAAVRDENPDADLDIPAAVDRAALLLAIEERSEPVAMPDEAVEVDLMGLLGGFMGGFGGDLGGEPNELPTDLPTPFPTDLPTAFPTDPEELQSYLEELQRQGGSG